jgi:cytochrome bd-type quinol oxidase subunit 2
MEKLSHYLLLLITPFVGFREIFINQNVLFDGSFSSHTQTLLILLAFMLIFIVSMIMNIREKGKSINPKSLLITAVAVIAVMFIECYPYLKDPKVAESISHLGSLSILTIVTFITFVSLLALFGNTEDSKEKNTSRLIY